MVAEEILEEVKFEAACSNSVQKHSVFPCHLKTLGMKYDIFYESEAWSLTPKEGTKEITRRSIKLHNKELYDLYTSKYILIGIIKK